MTLHRPPWSPEPLPRQDGGVAEPSFLAEFAPMLQALSETHDAVLLVDPRGVVVWCSDGLAALGLHPGDITSARCWSLLFARPDEGDALTRQLRSGGSVAGRRVCLRTHSGVALPVELTIARLLAPSAGMALVLLRCTRDEAGDAPRDLQPALDSLQSILDCAPDPAFAVDRAGAISFANPAFARLLGRAPSSLVGAPLGRLASEVPGLAALARRIQHGSVAFDEDVTLTLPGGDCTLFAASAAPLTLRDGARAGTLVQLREMTHERERSEILARENAGLEAFVQNVSHDLRTPLTSLLGYLRILREDHGERVGESGRYFLDGIEQAARRIEALATDLLELSRAGSRHERGTFVDPLGVLHQLRLELKPRLESRGVRLVLPATVPVVLCDRTHLYQVFANLIGNALDHMGEPEAPQIAVEILDEDGTQRISVLDNGRGVDPAQRERIFEPFHTGGPRFDGTIGTGVGLAIVKKIADVYGGATWVESEPGRGAAFHVRLPAH